MIPLPQFHFPHNSNRVVASGLTTFPPYYSLVSCHSFTSLSFTVQLHSSSFILPNHFTAPSIPLSSAALHVSVPSTQHHQPSRPHPPSPDPHPLTALTFTTPLSHENSIRTLSLTCGPKINSLFRYFFSLVLRSCLRNDYKHCI